MKIYVMYEFKEGPYGGANQFLKAMKDYFKTEGYFTECIEDADIVLFNSSNLTREVLRAKKKYENKIFIERLDGPVRLYLYQNKGDKRDLIANIMNYFVADATIFQTKYSREANYQLGLKPNAYETIIINAPDENIFHIDGKSEFNRKRKIRLIASSWSANWNKGFEVYQYLDEKLNFEKYEMIFVGNSPITFQNITKMEPLASQELADLMRTCDVYITASENDPCSNSLIEAMFCGMPALALKRGGHPEIVGKAGMLFERKEEIIPLLDELCENYKTYTENQALLGRSATGALYVEFIKKVYDDKVEKVFQVKKMQWYRFLLIQMVLLYIKISDKIFRSVNKRKIDYKK